MAPSSSAARKAKAKQEEKPKVATAKDYTILEVDPNLEDPHLLHSLRSSGSDTTEAVWYVINGCHHVTGNLDLLTDLIPVSDRWVRGFMGPPMQVCAHGSVDSNGIILHDVWYAPESKVNLVSIRQLSGEGLDVVIGPNACTIKLPGGTLVGEAHVGRDDLFELDFLNTNCGAVWYIVSSAREHMTGNLELLTDFSPVRPSRAVRTHTGATLQVCGKGPLKSKQFAIPNISYVPGLNENIVSLSQLTDSGFTVEFGPDTCTVTRRQDGKAVGIASYGGDQLFRLNFLKVPFSQ